MTEAIEVPASWRAANRWAGSAYNGQLIDNLPDAARAIDEMGEGAVRVFLRSLDWYFVDTHTRELLLDVLTHVPVTATFEGLLSRASRTDVPKAFEAAAVRAPASALAVLDASQDSPFAGALRARLLASNPDLVARESALPIWSGGDVPELLTSPPWSRPKPAPVTISTSEIETSIAWLDQEERQIWSVDRWSPCPPDVYDHYLTQGDWALGYTAGTEERVRPLLANWEAEKFSFYLLNPRVLVAKYELDAYPAILRLARRKPAIGAELLAPYLSEEVALMMARWLAGSRQYGDLALSWFERHGAVAAIPLIPLALGKPTTAGATAAQALARLDPDLVRRAGDLLDAREEVDALLARDPLLFLPANVPRIPGWLAVDILPDVVDISGTYRLGNDEREAIIRMVAISDPEDPYPGLAVVAEDLEPDSLAELGWALFCHWHISGAPSKDAWAMNAVGYFGNDTIADRWGPLVVRWPHDGMAQRAKRGAELLARMEVPAGLRHLSGIARSARSTPLRNHAALVLSEAAADRGLLPEQLEDLLVDELGLQGEPISMRGVTYLPSISGDLELVLLDPAGSPTALPKAADEAEKATASAWNKRRRAAKAVLTSQARRFEEAMVVQRSWHITDFRTMVVGHPVLRALAARLVWEGDEQGTVDALGDLVGPDGGPLAEPEWLRIAHPAVTDLERWREWLHARSIIQPFAQVEREVADQDPSVYWGRVCSAASLHSLVRRGWHWGPTGHAAVRHSLIRSFGAQGNVVLTVEPGVSAVTDPAGEPDQTIEEVTFQSAEHDDLGVFSDLPASARSELARDLGALELQG